MPKVTLTINKAKKFLKKLKEAELKRRLHRLIELHLIDVWRNRVMTDDYKQVYKIETKDEMKELIKHRGTPDTADYNDDYLYRKEMGLLEKSEPPFTAGLPPHVLSGMLKSRIGITSSASKVEMKIDPGGGEIPGGNYFVLHEKNKSILKSTFVLAWAGIIEGLVEYLTREARTT